MLSGTDADSLPSLWSPLGSLDYEAFNSLQPAPVIMVSDRMGPLNVGIGAINHSVPAQPVTLAPSSAILPTVSGSISRNNAPASPSSIPLQYSGCDVQLVHKDLERHHERNSPSLPNLNIVSLDPRLPRKTSNTNKNNAGSSQKVVTAVAENRLDSWNSTAPRNPISILPFPRRLSPSSSTVPPLNVVQEHQKFATANTHTIRSVFVDDTNYGGVRAI